jgi:nucleotide sugar dehydrogenase
MKINQTNYPLFVGLSHIGQIYSISWIKKIGPCGVFDFDKATLLNFKKSKFTNEEKKLTNIRFNKKKITFCKNFDDIKNYNIIFFTYDTPLNDNGHPNVKYIENNLKKILKLKFDRKTTIFFTSQVYPGFTDYIKKKYLKNNDQIKLIYMVDTLKMGNAINRFLKPEQLIFGGEKKDNELISRLFKKFSCKKYIKSYKEAELIKISINLYLYFSVNLSNILDDFSKQKGIIFPNILDNLKNDKRIGKYSYVQPSPAISGGHLERDVFFIKKFNKNYLSRKIFSNLENFNEKRKLDLKNFIKKLIKKKKVKLLIIGISYKNSSFSLVNTIFKKIIDSKNISSIFYDSYFTKKLNAKLKIVKKLNIGLNKSDIVLFNYSNDKDLKIIKKKFSIYNKNKFLIDISSNGIGSIKDNINVINYYSKK